MTMTASARPIDGTLTHEVDVNGRHTIITDEPVALGGADAGPAPHELLAATLASCVSTVVALYARRKGWPLPGLCVDVRYENESDPREFEVRVHLPAGLTDGQVTRLQRVAESCPVRRALQAGFTFEEYTEFGSEPAITGG